MHATLYYYWSNHCGFVPSQKSGPVPAHQAKMSIPYVPESRVKALADLSMLHSMTSSSWAVSMVSVGLAIRVWSVVSFCTSCYLTWSELVST